MAYLSNDLTSQLASQLTPDQAAAKRRALVQPGQADPSTTTGTAGTSATDTPVQPAPFGDTGLATTGNAAPVPEADPRTGPIVARHGGIIDPATGQPTVGQPTGAAPVPAAPAPSPPPAPAPPPVNGYPIAQQPNPFVDQIRQLILSRLREAGNPVDPNAPQISSTLNAARTESQRQSAQERTALAERLYAQGQGGLGSDALTRQIQQSGEKNAASLSSLRANLIQQQYTQKFSELQNLLQLAVASGDAESARNVQLQLAALQAQVQREGIGSNLAIAGQNNNNITVAGGA
jgi:hypothetical protein